MKVVRALLFLLLAVMVFLGFITAFHIVPSNFEEQARRQTIERLEASGTVVDESYVEASIESAVKSNLHTVYRTALIAALAVALIVGCLSIRPPHDCGGFNLFNPLAIPLVAIIMLSLGVGISLVLDSMPGQDVAEFRQAIAGLSSGCTEGFDRLLAFAIVPLLLEVIFRGFILSFVEKLHFSAAIVISTAAYALAAYFCISKYAVWSVGSTACAWPAFFVAAAIGFVFSVMTWRLRSVIPAAVSHMLLANASGLIDNIKNSSAVSLPLAVIVLAISLALLVFLPVLLARRFPIFAYDYPFTRHHKRVARLLAGKRVRRAEPEEEEAEGKKDAAGEKEKTKQANLRLWPFIKKGVPDEESSPASAEKAAAEDSAEKHAEAAQTDEKPSADDNTDVGA